MNTDKVVEVVDTGVLPLPPPSQELDEKSTGTRTAPKPLVITQPDGASFEINGQEVRWQKWRFRYAMHPREGLVLHTVGYDDEGRLRPILYRGSLSEMVVPYGDTDGNWRWRSAFDVGEYSVGRLASSIEPKTDAPENATLIDATFAGDDGVPYVLPRALGIYERDGGLLWKHYEGYSHQERIAPRAPAGDLLHRDDRQLRLRRQLGLPPGRRARSRRGALRHHAAEGRARNDRERHMAAPGSSGHLVAANVVAPHHQHFFSFRLDFDVDGPKNVVHEMNTRARAAGPGNPFLNGIVMEETLLRTGDGGTAQDEHAGGADLAGGEHQSSAARSGTTRLHHCSGRQLAAVCRADLTGAAARRLHEQSFLGDAVQRGRDERRGRLSESEFAAATVCRAGSPTTSRWSIRTSSSGTRSASRTFRAPRSGR